MSVWLLLFACRPEAPVNTPPPTPEPEVCLADGNEVDCGQVDPCVQDLELLLACCTCDAAFCEPMACVPDDLPPDVGPALAFTRSLTAEIPALHEDDVAVGVTITPDLVLVGDDPLQAVQAVCTRAGNTFTCDEAFLTVAGAVRLRAWELQVQLTDGDGDGVADGGRMRVMGSFGSGGMQTPSEVAAVVDLQQDTEGRDAVLPIALLPTRPAVVRLGELVAGAPELGVDGVGRALEAVSGVGGIAAFRDLPDAPPLPWGAELTLAGDLRDLSGNPVGHQAGGVVADPGPFTDNLGFEGPGGWAAEGFEVLDASEASPDVPAPYEGVAFQHAWVSGALVGEATLPIDATTLSLHVAVTGGRTLPEAHLTVVEADGARTTVWTFDAAQVAECGTPYPYCMPWIEVQVDVSGWAGEQVWLELTAAPAGSPVAVPQGPPPPIGFSVDGLQVQ